MMATRTVAQRLGRLLEIVTRQSGRLPETPAYGSWLLGRLVGKPEPAAGYAFRLILTVFILATNLIGIGVATAAADHRLPVAQHLQRRTTVDHLRRRAGLHRCRAGARDLPDHPSDNNGVLRWAIEERQPTPADERSTLHGPVLVGARRAHPVGARRGIVDHALRAGRQHVHPDRGFLGELRRHFGGHRVLPVHRVRATPSGRAGAGGGPRAAAAGTGHHGPNTHGLATEFRRAGSRHRTDRILLVDAEKSERDPVWRWRCWSLRPQR